MKRFELAAAQMEFLRQAAFAVVRRDGPGALTRRALAAELGISDSVVRRNLDPTASLPEMAASVCERRRREAGYRRRRPTCLRDVAELLVPGADEVDVEVVWLRLRLHHGSVPVDADDLRARYQVATRGWSDDDGDAGRPVPGVCSEGLASSFSARDDAVRSVVARLTAGRPELVEPAVAVVDGLVLAVCTGRLDPDAARDVLLDHLEAVGSDLGEPG